MQDLENDIAASSSGSTYLCFCALLRMAIFKVNVNITIDILLALPFLLLKMTFLQPYPSHFCSVRSKMGTLTEI